MKQIPKLEKKYPELNDTCTVETAIECNKLVDLAQKREDWVVERLEHMKYLYENKPSYFVGQEIKRVINQIQSDNLKGGRK